MLAIANFWVLPSHSIVIKTKIRASVMSAFALFSKTGVCSRLFDAIVLRIVRACVTLSALKNIQAKVVSANVDIICRNSVTLGSMRPSATVVRCVLFLLNNSKGRKKMACKPPHTIKVQFAPCQKPLTKKIIKVLRTFVLVLPLLPPSGIYR